MFNEITLVFIVVIIVVMTYGTIKSLVVKNSNPKRATKHSPPMWTNTTWRGIYVPPPPNKKKDFKFFRGYD